MQHITDFHACNSRIIQIIDELSATGDQEFDSTQEELEREFAELRLNFRSHE